MFGFFFLDHEREEEQVKGWSPGGGGRLVGVVGEVKGAARVVVTCVYGTEERCREKDPA